MVICDHRTALKEALQAMATGRITTDEFLDRTENLELSNDSAVSTLLEHFAERYCDDDFFSYRLKGRNRLPRDARREFARAILFLRSDRPYEWPPDPASALGMLAAVVFVPGLLASMHFAMSGPLALGLLIFAFTIGAVCLGIRVANEETDWQSQGDFAVWPYFRQSDCDADARLPRAA